MSSTVTTEVGAALTDFDHRVAASILSLTHALRLPKDTLGYLVDYLSMNQPLIPISQVIGFTSFTAQLAFTQGSGTITTSTYGDLSDGVGPTLPGLPDGKYLFLYGAVAKSSIAGGDAVISIQDDDTKLAFMHGTDESTLFGAATADLSSGINSMTLRYRTGAAASTATFQYRRLISLKYADL